MTVREKVKTVVLSLLLVSICSQVYGESFSIATPVAVASRTPNSFETSSSVLVPKVIPETGEASAKRPSSRRARTNLIPSNAKVPSPVEKSPTAGSPADTPPTQPTVKGYFRPKSKSRRTFSVESTIVCLGVLALSGLAVVTFSRRNSATGVNESHGSLAISASLTVAPRCSVTLIHANDRPFLIARDASGIKCVVPVGGELEQSVYEEFKL